MIDAENLTLADLGRYHRYLMEVPYDITFPRLYNTYDLYDSFSPDEPSSFERCYDTRVYHHMLKEGLLTKNPWEMSARAMHDCNIRKHIHDFLAPIEPRLVVGIMGGHAMARTDEAYRQTVEASKRLTEKGYMMISGGGPGAMEATHLGAWLAGRTSEEVDDAVRILSVAPKYCDACWLSSALEVMKKYPLLGDYKSLSIPTWFYGHEPPCAFATHTAKFFDNSIREDVILTIAYGGLIYMPGSAGTIQEIFQEAVQDHYLSLGYASPMVFVGRQFWTEEIPVYPFMQHMIRTGKYKNMILSLVDTTDEIVKSIDDFRKVNSEK